MVVVIGFWGVLILVVVGMAAPPALRDKSWLRFFWSAFLSFVGILFPLFIFLASAFLVPDWKGGCHRGWIHCFHGGKIALTPLVLWASSAFYCSQILQRAESPTWVNRGLVVGAVTSTVCFVFGLYIHAFADGLAWWLLVPFYASLWYGILALRSMRVYGPASTYLPTLVGTLPLWLLSLFWSRRIYMSLPDSPPSCFVVTAASEGHPWLVGPYLEVERRGVSRTVNQQLTTFWQFEQWWGRHSPDTHRAFRCVYNRVGPCVARCVRYRILADLTYLVLKPAEWIASCVLRVACRNGRRIQEDYGRAWWSLFL